MRTTKASDYHWAIRRHFKSLDPTAKFSYEQPYGNVRLDMVVECNGEKVAVEIKSRNDDAIRGLAELAVAKAYGYNSCMLVTTKKKGSSLGYDALHSLWLSAGICGLKGTNVSRGWNLTVLVYVRVLIYKQTFIHSLFPKMALAPINIPEMKSTHGIMTPSRETSL